MTDLNESTTCNQCDLIIDDDLSSSIECNICSSWVHGDVKCSGLKKTALKHMKRVVWACPSCIDFMKRCRSEDRPRLDLEVGLDELKSEVRQVRDQNFFLFEENKKLTAKIIDLRKIIASLKRPSRSGSGGIGSKSQDNNSSSSKVKTSDVFDQSKVSVCSVNDSNIFNLCDPTSPEINVNEPVLVQHRPLGTTQVNKPKINLFADSHGRGLLKMVQTKVESLISVNLFPSAPMKYYVSSLISEAKARPKGVLSETNVLLGGVNDVSKESIESCLKLLEENADSLRNMIVVETPFRFDDANLNQLIKQQNDRLMELCTKLKWKFVSVNFALCRAHYTSHGLHLNAKGKKLISHLISECVSHVDIDFLKL